MKRPLIAAAGFALAVHGGLAGAVSWQVFVQPGVYGRVAIGGYLEAPRVYSPQPVMAVINGSGRVVEEAVDPAYATDQPPVYLWVPEYQRLHWAEYSGEYGAYGVPVYFVDDAWYRANVLRRNWTPEQRSWTEQQWLEQDRLARDRIERLRFEQQRLEQQQRWESQRIWRNPQPPGGTDRVLAEQQRQRQAEDQRTQQARVEREHADQQDTRGHGFWAAIRRAFAPQRQASASGTGESSAASRPQGVDQGIDRGVDRGDHRGGFDRPRGIGGGGFGGGGGAGGGGHGH